MKNQIKERKGITLIGLIVTIIILLILAGVTVMTLTGDNGLLTKAGEAKDISEKGEIEEQIKLAYNEWKLRKETGETVDLQNTVQTTLDKMYDNATVNKQGKAISINVKGYEFTLIDDGTMEEGKLAYLDIADGSIQLKSNGYIQGSNALVPYTGKYIITGTTTENTVRVMEEGKYNVTIRNLNIDVSNLSNNTCAFNANAGKKALGCFVNLTINGNNYLKGGGNYAPGLGFANAKQNTKGVTDGSTLIINGNGNLETRGNGWAAGIGSGYTGATGGNVDNIIINSGNITAIGSGNGCGINSNSIIINGGSIRAIGNNVNAGLGGNTKSDITINGGNVYARGGSLSRGIVGSVKITGGKVIAEGMSNHKSFQGDGIYGDEIIIIGGTINTKAPGYAGISCTNGGGIKITGGNILARGKNNLNIATYEEGTSNLVPYIPTRGTNNLYETQIKLNGIEEGKKVTNFTSSDNIEYGIKDMYTLDNGMLYLYLPTGTRTITIEVEGKKYSGTVQTTETPEEVTLNEIN